MDVGQRIKERRRELKMSVDDLAKKLNKNRATIYRYEKGDIENLPLEILKPLSEALQTTPQQLMGWEDTHTGLKETSVGRIVKVIRRELRISSEEFSKELGITKEELKMYESGTVSIPLEIMDTLAEHLNVALANLFGKKYQYGGKQALYFSTDAVYVNHFEMWNAEFNLAKFTDEEVRKIIDYAKFLISQRPKENEQ